MTSKHNPILLAILSLAFASLACQSLAGTAPASTQEPQPIETQEITPTEAPPQPEVEPATVDSKGAGILCVGSGTGLRCLNEDGWKIYTSENSGLPNNYLYAGAVCPDGQIAVAHISGVALFDGTTFQQIPEMESSSSAEGVACAADGSIWVAHFQGVSHYVDGQWTTYGPENLASGESANELVYDVEVAPDGRVWVVTSRSVAFFENETWTIFQEGQGFSESRFFNALTLDARGRPWAGHSNGVDIFESGAWQSFELTDYNTPEAITIDSKGQAWLGTLTSGAFLFDGNTWTQYDRASERLRSDHVRSISADSGGRVWLGTTYGLTVFDGANWQTFLMSNSGLGDNNIEFVIVTNDGPALPALEEKEKGSLTGTIEKVDGTPLADARVEICVETLASTFSGDTPCSDQPFSLSTTTDTNGVFLIENIPTAYYVIVAETGDGGWAQLTDEYGISSEKTLIEAGENHDIGTLTLEE
ncbi:MAG: two-component regulator propeller domain-containing protein [Anaerolineales bacterium]